MRTMIGPRLSIMMFLQFFIWGAWYVTVGNYMDKNGMGDAIYWAYTVGPIAAIISPFFLGMIADRFFATERVLAVMQIVGGVALYLSPRMVGVSLDADSPIASAASAFGISPAHLPFIGMLLLHMLCYMPTLGLTNTLAFHNLSNRETWFPLIRVFGTLGWIVANIVVSKLLKADEKALPLEIAGGAAVLMGLYSFTLPHTPPPAAGQKVSVRGILGLDSLALMKQPSFAVFIISSLLICIPLAAYYAYAPVFVKAAGIEDPAYQMSFGQMSEVVFMVVMPLFFLFLGVKWMLLVGMFAWVLRYALFAAAAPEGVYWMILGGILLHGICYDFFFVTGQIYVDKKAYAAIRGQAQGFLVLVTQGIGMLIGAQVSGKIFNKVVVGQGTDALRQWQQFWAIPCIAAGVIMVAFAILFRDKVAGEEKVTEAEVAQAAAREENP